MLTLKARYFIDLGQQFHELSVLFIAANDERPTKLTGTHFGVIQAHFEKVMILCHELKLSVSKELIRARLASSSLPRTSEAFETLKDMVYTEISDRWFAYIPPDRLDFFCNDQIVTFEVRQAFPRATAEIMNAGTCFAMGLATASVFHAMRAAEIGVQTMAIKLGVVLTYPLELAEFGKLIGEIEDKIILIKKGQRSTKNDEDIKFYSEAAAQFRHFNNGWRIRAAHSRETYEDDQAKKVLGHVTDFFSTLAERLSEPPI